MRASDRARAVATSVAVVRAAGLNVDEATVIHDSDRISVRLQPADVVARVAYELHRPRAEFEVDVARCLAETGSPIGTLDPRVEPRVHPGDGFAVTLWSYYETLPSEIAAPDYAEALLRLHAGMRQAEIMTPHFTDRVAAARSLLGDLARTPQLGDVDRELLSRTLTSLPASITDRGADEQLLHGEPHPGNVLHTSMGPLFVDLETVVRGPVEFDIVHAPEQASEYYPTADPELLVECRILMLAMITTWRWNRDDQLPNGRQLGTEWISQLRTALDRYRLDPSH
jgi:phosphotransferase family enzyme